MNKHQFIADVHKRHKGEIACDGTGHKMTLEAVTFWTELVFQELRRCIIENDDVNISGFGKFDRGQLTDRELVNPFGQPVQAKAHKRVKFVPSYHLKEAVSRNLTYEEYQDMVDKYRAVARGEYVPGFYIKNRKLYEGTPEEDE